VHFTFDVELYAPLRQDRKFLHAQGRTWEKILDALERHHIRVTLFTTGEFVTIYPALFQRMVAAGHEIASHTMTHRPYFSIGDEEFEQEIATSRTFLEQSAGRRVRGFRAPLGQIPPNVSGLLHRHGYTYDSSIAATHIPGHFQGLFTPRRMYRPALDNVRREDGRSPFWEIPIAVTQGLPIPYGGFFLSGVGPLVWKLPRLRRQPHVMFLHPHDFMDMRVFSGCYPWDRFKLTRNNWRLLDYFCRHRQGCDTTLESLMPGDAATPGGGE